MAYRFRRLGTTAPISGGQLARAIGPAPYGLDDPASDDFSNLDIVANSDPVYVGDLTSAAVWVYSDATSTSSLRVKGGPTKTGPWTILDGGAIANTALATPTVVNVFASNHPEYVIVTTSSWSAGNPRALLVGEGY